MTDTHVMLPVSVINDALERIDRVWLALPPGSPARADAVTVMRLLREGVAVTVSVPAPSEARA